MTEEGDATIPLLETKLHAPRRRGGIVPRPRLQARRDRRTPPALTVVSAPAGYGKSTLLAEWFADDPTTAWLSLDRRDNDAARFWTYVVAALRTVDPDVGAVSLPMLRSPETTTEVAVTTLLNELNAVTDDVVLVLDDYHLVDSLEIQDAMTFFLEHLPPRIRLVVAGRADPPWPLATLRARGDLLDVRAADLRFTSDEAAIYLNDTMGLTLDAADIDAIEDRTEGWIAALQLAALSMQDRDDVSAFIASFAGDDRYIVDYLMGEVLVRQTEHDRTFLLHTSILSRLTEGLCDAVTGRDCAQSTLERLDRANMFLVALDDRRAWYRYHHLFADVLRARLQDEEPSLVPELHGRASDWYDAHGDRSEAIRHALAGEDVARAARLIELAASEMHQTRQEAELRRWLEELPEDVFRDRPVLAIHLVGARMSTGDPARVEQLLDLVEARLDPAAPPPIVFDHENLARLPAQLAVYRAALALLVGDLDGTIGHADRALALSAPTDHLQRGAAAALMGLAYWTRGDLEAARVQYVEAVASLVAADHLPDVLGCSLGLADIQIAQGRLDDAFATLTAGLGHAAAIPGMRGTADMHVGLSEVLLERNELDDAAAHLQVSADLGEHTGLPQHAYRWRVATARLRQSHGDLDGALALLEDAAPVYDTDFSPAVRPVAARTARVQVARGDVGAALRWAASRGLTPEDALDYVREYEHITLARILLARHAARRDERPGVESAIGLLERLRVAAEEGQRTGSVVEILVLLTMARHAIGDATGTAATLADALALAAAEGYVRVFLDEGPAMTALLSTVGTDDDAGRHARRVLAATGSPAPAVPSPAGLVDDLSPRELDVLRLLRTDLSGPDIASELHVSLNTFRTHTKSIYTKLGATNRRQAIRRAAELGR